MDANSNPCPNSKSLYTRWIPNYMVAMTTNYDSQNYNVTLDEIHACPKIRRDIHVGFIGFSTQKNTSIYIVSTRV